MQSRFGKIFIITILGVFIFTSCAPLPPPGTALTPEQRADAQKQCIAKYTAGGAIGGALVGALIGGKKWEGAAIGALAGGALAFALAYGHCLSLYSDLRSYPAAGAQETAQRIGYNPSQGYVTRIENFSLNPTGVAPGGKVQINGSYYVMAPEGSRETKVTETRTVQYFDSSANDWKELGSVDQEVTSAIGTRRAEGNFDLPADVPEGRYRITMKVAANGVQDQASQELTVKKGLAMGPSQQPQMTQTAYMQSTQPQQTGGKALGQPAQKKLITATVSSKSLSVRQEPSGKSRILATVKQGEVHEVLQNTSTNEGMWYKLRLDSGTEGWVSGKYVRIQE